MKNSVDENDEENSGLGIESLEVFEGIAWCMVKHADPDNVPDDPDDWLEQFNVFSIYQILPELMKLWGMWMQRISLRRNRSRVRQCLFPKRSISSC